jgi:hypothetical protein
LVALPVQVLLAQLLVDVPQVKLLGLVVARNVQLRWHVEGWVLLGGSPFVLTRIRVHTTRVARRSAGSVVRRVAVVLVVAALLDVQVQDVVVVAIPLAVW